MSAHEHQLSQAAFDRLQVEVTELKTVGRIEIARKIEVAREMGDLKENGDYHAAKEEQGKMEARIGHLSALLELAVVIEHDGDVDEVTQGCVVTIVYEDDDDEERYLIGSIEERRPDIDVMSPTSPLGSALLGQKAGAEVSYDLPNGSMAKVEILRVER